MTDLLFVYGTLRRGCAASAGPEAQALHAASGVIGPARMRGRLYRVDWYPALVVEEAQEPAEADGGQRRGTGWVAGDLVRLHDPAGTLAMLDAYEECEGAGDALPEYRRERTWVTGPSGEQVLAWVYVYNLPVEGLAPILSGDWLDPA